ncbi:MAG: Orotate phosphoribosyltransferase [Chroococcopsis gigantea SAG 12.99]|jgi:uridine monophosphate synthetase|nr:bifunctional orotidine-5'-phosphate decarboxylase/orotate phosphoribosyltransferase [Chlorogloea purpurea SAG 13.99]MDV2999232.1 Orotate phosphoribosyltransferase [Chroococcopsis gigantea SAG 12.99]
MIFIEKLNGAITHNQSLLVIALDPNPEMMPSADTFQGNEDELINALESWLTGIISTTSGLVCAYKPTLGFYEAFGGKGLDLLIRLLQKIPDNIPVILDAKHGDLNTSSVFARTIFNTWNVDAVTLNPYIGQDHTAPFLVYPDRGVFILCHTSNPGAVNIQGYPGPDNPFYLQVIREAQTWASPENLFLEVGTTSPEILAKIRSIAPERWILLRSIWSKTNNLSALLLAGFNGQNSGLLLPVPQDWLKDDGLVDKLKNLREEINNIRTQRVSKPEEATLWTPNVCLLNQHPHQDLILQLYDIGCLIFGEYVQASGAIFSYYIDLRRIISNPQLFQEVLKAYSEILKELKFDRIAGIPYGSLPTATGLSMLLHRPMIFPRKEVKAHGTRRLIEGDFQPGETVVVVDDILISGKSAIEGAEKLQSAGLIVNDIVVLIDHEEGVKDKLKQRGYNAYSVLGLSEISDTLFESGRLSQEQYDCVRKH